MNKGPSIRSVKESAVQWQSQSAALRERKKTRSSFANLSLRLATIVSSAALLIAMFASAKLLYCFYFGGNDFFQSFTMLALSGVVQAIAQVLCLFARSHMGSKSWILWSIFFSVPAFWLSMVVWQGVTDGALVKTGSGNPTILLWCGLASFGAAATSVGCYLTYLRTTAVTTGDVMIQEDSRWVFYLFLATAVLVGVSVYSNEVMLPKLLRRNIPYIPTAIKSMMGVSGVLFYISSLMSLIFFYRIRSEAKHMITDDRAMRWYQPLLCFFVR